MITREGTCAWTSIVRVMVLQFLLCFSPCLLRNPCHTDLTTHAMCFPQSRPDNGILDRTEPQRTLWLPQGHYRKPYRAMRLRVRLLPLDSSNPAVQHTDQLSKAIPTPLGPLRCYFDLAVQFHPTEERNIVFGQHVGVEGVVLATTRHDSTSRTS